MPFFVSDFYITILKILPFWSKLIENCFELTDPEIKVLLLVEMELTPLFLHIREICTW